jgi:hypothetical protein
MISPQTVALIVALFICSLGISSQILLAADKIAAAIRELK